MNKPTVKQQIQRLEQALRVMNEMTPHERRKHFDMNTWGEITSCGTVGCLAGHCGMDPWFRRRGFKFNFPKLTAEERKEMRIYGDSVEGDFVNAAGNWDFDLPERFFGEDINCKIFLRRDSTYSKVKLKVKRAIKLLKTEGHLENL